jgi:hypothetical protein
VKRAFNNKIWVFLRGFVRVEGKGGQREGDKEERLMGFSCKNNAKKRYFLAVFRGKFGKKRHFRKGVSGELCRVYGGFGEERLKALTTKATKEHEGKTRNKKKKNEKHNS